jgi:Neprosin
MTGWDKTALEWGQRALIIAVAVVGVLSVPGQLAAGLVAGHLMALRTGTTSECPGTPPNAEGYDKYYYVTVLECGADYKGASANLTLPEKLPTGVDPEGHAIGEIAIWQSIETVDGVCDKNGIEAGWTVENKDRPKKIKFFVFKTEAKQKNTFFSGYAPSAPSWPGSGWISLGVSPQPDEELAAGQPLKLRIHYDPSPANEHGRWYVSVNDRDVGYYRGDGWSGHLCGDFKPDRIAWYGEVSTHGPCAEMGNGFPGTDSRAVGFSQLKSAPSKDNPVRRIAVTDRDLYSSDVANSGNNFQEFSGDAFRYGGPGKCDKQQTSVKQQKSVEKQKPVEQQKPVEKQKPVEQQKPIEKQKPIEEPPTLVDPRTGFEPTSGRPGSTPNLFGGGFYPNKDITITESSPAGSRPVGVITPDASGSFDIMFRIPDSTPAGHITYTFRQEPDVKVWDTFLVGGPPEAAPPSEEAAPPSEEAAPPSEEAAPPSEEAAPPPEEAAPPPEASPTG